MKKKIILVLCISTLLIIGFAQAETLTKNLKGFDINVQTSTNTTKYSETAVKMAFNKAAMKAQISAINSKMNSLSSVYQLSVNNLANNLLPKEQLKKYNEEKTKIQNDVESKPYVNIEIAEDGTITLNKYVKSSASQNTFKNLTLSQKAAIKKDLKILESVSNSYTQIAEQLKSLTKQIKNDPVATMELKADLTDMVKNEVKVTKQVKNISKLIKNITESVAKSGISL